MVERVLVFWSNRARWVESHSSRVGTAVEAAMSGPQIPAGFDFTDPDLYAARVPNEEFAELRRAAPIWWNEQPDCGFEDGGCWLVSKHADIVEISRNSDLFGSWENTAIIRHGTPIKDS